MMETRGSRWGFLGGVAGGILGGLIWVVVAGVTLHDWLVVGSAVLVAAAVWWGAVAAIARFPTRPLGVLGAIVLAVVLVDWIYLVLLLPRLSTLPAYPWFGASSALARALRPLLVAGSLGGVAAVLIDMLRRRPE